MIALALLTLAQAVPLVAVPDPAPAARSPIDWTALPPLPYRRAPQPTTSMIAFVSSEIHRNECPRPMPVDGHTRLQIDVAVLIGEDRLVRATIPRAIGCPVVEQYGAGLVVSFARGNLMPQFVSEGGWYRASLQFDWTE